MASLDGPPPFMKWTYSSTKEITDHILLLGKQQGKNLRRSRKGGGNWFEYRCEDYVRKQTQAQRDKKEFDPSQACCFRVPVVKSRRQGNLEPYEITKNAVWHHSPFCTSVHVARVRDLVLSQSFSSTVEETRPKELMAYVKDKEGLTANARTVYRARAQVLKKLPPEVAAAVPAPRTGRKRKVLVPNEPGTSKSMPSLPVPMRWSYASTRDITDDIQVLARRQGKSLRRSRKGGGNSFEYRCLDYIRKQEACARNMTPFDPSTACMFKVPVVRSRIAGRAEPYSITKSAVWEHSDFCTSVHVARARDLVLSQTFCQSIDGPNKVRGKDLLSLVQKNDGIRPKQRTLYRARRKMLDKMRQERENPQPPPPQEPPVEVHMPPPPPELEPDHPLNPHPELQVHDDEANKNKRAKLN